jgi:hypothetical protein
MSTLSAETLYKKDERVVTNGRYFGIRPQFRPALKRFGASTWLTSLGYHDKERNLALDWFDEGLDGEGGFGIVDFYCQASLSGHHQMDPARVIEIIDNIFERGGIVTVTIVNFTRPVLQRLTAAQKAAVLASPIAVKNAKHGLAEAYAAKLAIALGWNSLDKALLSWTIEYIQQALAPYAKYKNDPRFRVRFRSEVDEWEPLTAETNRVTALACGWNTTTSVVNQAEAVRMGEAEIRRLGYVLLDMIAVHGYFQEQEWRDPNDPTAPPQKYIGQWYLSYPDPGIDPQPKWGMFEAMGNDGPETLRLLLDAGDRGAVEIYPHTLNVCYQAHVRAGTKESVDQYRSKAIALQWVGGKAPLHEGAAIFDPARAAAIRTAANVLRLKAA